MAKSRLVSGGCGTLGFSSLYARCFELCAENFGKRLSTIALPSRSKCLVVSVLFFPGRKKSVVVSHVCCIVLALQVSLKFPRTPLKLLSASLGR